MFTKYTTIDKYAKSGTPDNITALQPEDDAATAKNANWHTPTYDELVALSKNCVLVWTSDYNSTGNAGYIVYKAKNDADKGKANMNGTWKMWDAANSKYSANTGSEPTGYSTSDIHIFLPAAGYGNDTKLVSKNTAGAYCSSDLNNTNNHSVGAVNFNKSVFNIAYNYFRSYGFSIRPVMNFSGITPAKQTDGTYQFTMPGYAVTVTAEFEAAGDTPSFDPCNGEAVTASETAPATAPKWGNYTFAGWYTARTGGTELTGTPAGGTTYYAHWTNKAGNGVLEVHGGTKSGSNPVFKEALFLENSDKTIAVKDNGRIVADSAVMNDGSYDRDYTVTGADKSTTGTDAGLTLTKSGTADIVITANSGYAFEVTAPGTLKVNEECSTASVTLEADRALDIGYDKVLIKIEMTAKPDGANPQILATDSQSVEWNIAEVGRWGPSEGFAVSKDYDATTPLKLKFDKAGTYTATFKLIDLNNSNAVLCESSKTIEVSKTDQTVPTDGEGYTVDFESEKITPETGYEVSTGTGDGFAAGKLSGETTIDFNKSYYVRKAADDNHKHHLKLMFTLCDEFQKGREENRTEGETIQYQVKKRMEVLENEKIRQYESYANGHMKKDAYPYIPCGKNTVLQGDPGGGKSTVIMDLIGRLTTGRKLLDGRTLEPINVLYQCSEDGLADTINQDLRNRVLIVIESVMLARMILF